MVIKTLMQRYLCISVLMVIKTLMQRYLCG